MTMKRIFYILFLLLMSTGVWAQQIGTPFFRNYPSNEYNAHNRNFDIMCDEAGYVYVANFEGLLVYDGNGWIVKHTPGISRVISLSRDEKGRVWFSGINVKGRIEEINGDSIRVYYAESDKDSQITVEGLTRLDEEVDRWEGIEVYKRLRVSDDRTILATASAGVIAIDEAGNKVWEINEEKGLCSNNVKMIDYDGKGTVWGATDNGLFCISISEIYTKFASLEGLHGQVMCIGEAYSRLFAGGLQGLFYQDGDRFVRMSEVELACWQMDITKRGSLLAATSNGVYEYDGKVRRLSDNMSLSILVDSEESFISGELDGVYRRWYDGRSELIGKIPNVIRLEADEKGGAWALTLGGEHYYLPSGGKNFVSKTSGPISQLMEYTDYKGRHWRCNDDGIGLRLDGAPEELVSWLKPFSKYNIQAMYAKDGIVWLGGSFGLIRFNLDESTNVRVPKPQVYIRGFERMNRNLHVSMANDVVNPLGNTLYSFRLHEDDSWSKWDLEQELNLHNLAYGSYHLEVRSLDPYGQVSMAEESSFTIPYPIFMRWYAVVSYFLLLILISVVIYKYRTRVLRMRQEQLERIVTERTQEVVNQKNEIELQKDEIESQKNEIEEKSNRLETTLVELREAQHELVRKEREATVGKLTKGLIDRILNPMNYINNFSHLTVGLTKELKENIEHESERMDVDTYDDCVDVIELMSSNLEKIEQHGMATTRTLKAMEEMLNERISKIETTDVALLCAQAFEILKKHYEEDIARYNIRIEWVKPPVPIVAEVNSDLMSKVIMSILQNAMYAVKKKADRQGYGMPVYEPLISLDIYKSTGEVPPVLTFYDNGIGIEEGIIDKVFDPFFTTKPTSEATGVSLYLSQQIIQDFGGSITVESEKDSYTKFIISLP